MITIRQLIAASANARCLKRLVGASRPPHMLLVDIMRSSRRAYEESRGRHTRILYGVMFRKAARRRILRLMKIYIQ